MFDSPEVVKKAFVVLLVLYGSLTILHLLSSLIQKKPIEWKRISSIAMIYGVFPILIGFPPFVLTAGLSFLIFFAIREIYDAAQAKNPDNVHPLYRRFSLVTATLVPPVQYLFPDFWLAYLVFTMIGLFCLPVLNQDSTKALDKIARAIVCILFSAMMCFLQLLRLQADGVALAILLVFLTNISDMLAYIFGKLFGRHKLIPKVSPGKTVEGSLLSLIALFPVALVLCRFLLPHYASWRILPMALMIGIASQMGDLVFSVFKRDVGIKDYGHIIPGHGGILDRFDSLVIASPLLYYLLKLLQYVH